MRHQYPASWRPASSTHVRESAGHKDAGGPWWLPIVPEDAAFIGWSARARQPLPFARVMAAHVELREACHATLHVERELPDGLWPIVAHHSMMYVFNAYKCVSMLLPQLHYEAASPIVRLMWESCLDPHWVSRDPVERSRDNAGFTLMEFRKSISAQQRLVPRESATIANVLLEFDSATRQFQEPFTFVDDKGTQRRAPSFSRGSIEQRARDLRDPWSSEYLTTYALLSSYSHASPGAVLNALFLAHMPDRDQQEHDRASLLGLTAMRLLMRSLRVLAAHNLIHNIAACESIASPLVD